MVFRHNMIFDVPVRHAEKLPPYPDSNIKDHLDLQAEFDNFAPEVTAEELSSYGKNPPSPRITDFKLPPLLPPMINVRR